VQANCIKGAVLEQKTTKKEWKASEFAARGKVKEANVSRLPGSSNKRGNDNTQSQTTRLTRRAGILAQRTPKEQQQQLQPGRQNLALVCIFVLPFATFVGQGNKVTGL